MSEKKINILNPDTEYEIMEIKNKWDKWEISSVDKDGDVEISCDSEIISYCLYLNQDELKQVIAFLQKQVK